MTFIDIVACFFVISVTSSFMVFISIMSWSIFEDTKLGEMLIEKLKSKENKNE